MDDNPVRFNLHLLYRIKLAAKPLNIAMALIITIKAKHLANSIFILSPLLIYTF